ncbi:MAG: hypothetical protein V2I36_05550 [Desulfopila sp.]|jgi:hypothetical protein|nr:hypothetical protein [Desulfopila sp.]
MSQLLEKEFAVEEIPGTTGELFFLPLSNVSMYTPLYVLFFPQSIIDATAERKADDRKLEAGMEVRVGGDGRGH